MKNCSAAIEAWVKIVKKRIAMKTNVSYAQYGKIRSLAVLNYSNYSELRISFSQHFFGAPATPLRALQYKRGQLSLIHFLSNRSQHAGRDTIPWYRRQFYSLVFLGEQMKAPRAEHQKVELFFSSLLLLRRSRPLRFLPTHLVLNFVRIKTKNSACSTG